MIVGIIDTHAAIWYLYNDVRLSNRARDFLEETAIHGDQIGLSTISLIEIIYLVEKAKIPSDTYTRLLGTLQKQDSVFTEIPLDLSIAHSVSQVNRGQIPDMPDRIIAATALHHNVPLVSRDERIQVSRIHTIW